MTPDLANQVTAGVLILTLASVLLIALMLVLLALSYLKRSRNALAAMGPTPGGTRIPRYVPVAFGGLSRWFAVRSTRVQAVADALELDNALPCSWGDGMAQASEHSLFISPPVNGWILIVGQAVPDFAEDVDECFRLVLRLSQRLGHVQYFGANRAVDHHAWVQAQDGKIVRAYAWASETLWNQGEVTEGETELELKCFDYGEERDTAQFISSDSYAANAEKIGFLAARWSFDPAMIETSMLPAEQGIAGNPIHSR